MNVQVGLKGKLVVQLQGSLVVVQGSKVKHMTFWTQCMLSIHFFPCLGLPVLSTN